MKFSPPRAPRHVDHAIVYRREDEFCSWPFTSGFWENAQGELIANFTARTVSYTSGAAIRHDVLGKNSTGPKTVTVRSRDRGRTWDGAHPQLNMMAGPGGGGGADAMARMPGAFAEPVDYLDRNILVANGSGGGFATASARGTVNLSRDGGKTWGPTVLLPLDGLAAMTGVQSTLIRPDGRCLLFMFSVEKDNSHRHPLVYGSTNQGREFHFMSYITPRDDPWGQADGDYSDPSVAFIGHRWFYPRGYLLPNGRILCTLRCQRDPTGVMWSEVYCSDDGGETWAFLSRINDYGAPVSLVILPDGRIVAVYGYRLMPSGIRATVSEDGGQSWGPEIIVRDDGGSWDLGYPNAWLADKGEIGVLYYFNSKDDKIQANGGVRHIQRSIFSID
ncbi:sialidase family protein [Sphingobium nicotianae]|uniref:Glycoside hydrolase n=1 Tax=Sphingobium nicotianae TaxID=2782607 RepID=A0A9X1DE55_9SPHN|nr:sialidase family protein [Sphingobium nicotianae]MBT2188224.1 glycoside hydrolase [Sphingobium nicotianae]